MINKNFDKDAVYRLRNAMRMSQSAFANLCGVTPRSVYKWENGDTIPTSTSLLLSYIQQEFETTKNNVATSIIGDNNNGNNVGNISENTLLEILKKKDEQIAQRDNQIELLIKKLCGETK